MNSNCLSCGTISVEKLIDFGPQPASNCYQYYPDEPLKAHALQVGQCCKCGLVQLIDPMPSKTVQSKFEWISYNEPEGHLDSVADKLASLLSERGREASILGLTYKDASTLRRLSDRGFSNTYCLDLGADLGLSDVTCGLESIQQVLTSDKIIDIAERYGPVDLLSVRHILEHAHDPLAMLTNLRKLVKPEGYLWFEMPDSSRFLKACDYIFLWEEHITYFTIHTLEAFLDNADIETLSIEVFPYQFEDSLVAFVKNSRSNVEGESNSKIQSFKLASELAIGQEFAARFSGKKREVSSILQSLKQQGNRIRLFGAGHLAAKFLNLYAVSEHVDGVIDDHEQKQKMFMPGSGLSIDGSSLLLSTDVVLSTLSQESEVKVKEKNSKILNGRRRFVSVFCDHPESIFKIGEK